MHLDGRHGLLSTPIRNHPSLASFSVTPWEKSLPSFARRIWTDSLPFVDFACVFPLSAPASSPPCAPAPKLTHTVGVSVAYDTPIRTCSPLKSLDVCHRHGERGWWWECPLPNARHPMCEGVKSFKQDRGWRLVSMGASIWMFYEVCAGRQCKWVSFPFCFVGEAFLALS